MTLLDKTFENLLRGLDAKSDPKSLQSSTKKFDLNTRLAQYANGERDFFHLANAAEMDMRAKVSQLNLQKSPLQPVINDIFLRKPKRHGDKSTVSNDARTNFVDLFDKMNAFWELSDSKKNAGMMFDLKLEGGDKELAGQNNTPQTTEQDNATPTSHHLTPIKNIPQVQTNLTTGPEVVSPIYNTTAASPFSKVGTFLTVDTNQDRNKGLSPINTADLTIDKKYTPGMREDSLDTSQFKPVHSMPASREILDNEKEEENKRFLEEKKKEEEEKKKIELTNKKVEYYMEQIPDFGYMLSNEIVKKE